MQLFFSLQQNFHAKFLYSKITMLNFSTEKFLTTTMAYIKNKKLVDKWYFQIHENLYLLSLYSFVYFLNKKNVLC